MTDFDRAGQKYIPSSLHLWSAVNENKIFESWMEKKTNIKLPGFHVCVPRLFIYLLEFGLG